MIYILILVYITCIASTNGYIVGHGAQKMTKRGSIRALRHFGPLRNSMGDNMGSSGTGGGQFEQRPERSTIPQRKDTCSIFVSGVIGTDPREAFLSNGHYVLNFALAVVGHFEPVHDWEKYKPTETMWMSAEVWDDMARNHQTMLTKGTPVSALGYMIHNKWQDKTTGEERKQFKLRITNILNQEEMQEMLGASGALDLIEEASGGGGDRFNDYDPGMEDQSMSGDNGIGSSLDEELGGGGVDQSDDIIPF